MKKKLLLAPLMAVLVACVVVLSGCGGPSVEELITEDLTTQFDEVKNGGDDFLAGLEEASGDEFKQLGIDPKEYAKSYLEGFGYKIGDVTVDEGKGTATAEVTITCKSMNQIVEDFATQYQEKVTALGSSSLIQMRPPRPHRQAKPVQVRPPVRTTSGSGKPNSVMCE